MRGPRRTRVLLRAVSRIGLPAAVIVAVAAAWPGTALAADCVVPPVSVPEAPGGPILLLLMGLGVVTGLSVIRRRGGVPAVVVSALAVVVLAGALFGVTAAGAATCTPVASGGGVLGVSTTTVGSGGTRGSVPSTGADLPWVDAMILVGGGGLLTIVAAPRRRKSPRDGLPPQD